MSTCLALLSAVGGNPANRRRAFGRSCRQLCTPQCRMSPLQSSGMGCLSCRRSLRNARALATTSHQWISNSAIRISTAIRTELRHTGRWLCRLFVRCRRCDTSCRRGRLRAARRLRAAISLRCQPLAQASRPRCSLDQWRPTVLRGAQASTGQPLKRRWRRPDTRCTRSNQLTPSGLQREFITGQP